MVAPRRGMEMDITDVIAALEDEQTLIVSRAQLAASPSVARRRARTIDAVGGLLLGLGGSFLAVLAASMNAGVPAREIGSVVAGLATLGVGALMVARSIRDEA